jgi:hypothetical protein
MPLSDQGDLLGATLGLLRHAANRGGSPTRRPAGAWAGISCRLARPCTASGPVPNPGSGKRPIARGWQARESGTYPKYTDSGAELFA